MDYSAFLARSGRSRDALPYSQEAYALAQRVENPYLLGLAAGVMSMAVPAERQRFAQQAISLLRQVAVAEGDLDQAGHYLQQSLNAYTKFYAADGSHISPRDFQYLERSQLIEALLAAARIQAAQESPDSAARLLSFAEQMLQERPYRLDPPVQAMVDDLHDQLDVPALAPAWADGRAMTLEQAVREAMNVERHETRPD